MKAKYSVGDVCSSNNFGAFTIVSYEDRFNITIEFNNTKHRRVVSSSAISQGGVRDHMAPSVCGVGVIGGPYCKGGKPKAYVVWHGMLARCYDTDNAHFDTYGGAGVVVCDEWLYFPSFKSWFDDNYIDGYQIDKDLSGMGIYSPESCRFISRADNTKEMLQRRNPKPFKVQKGGVIYEGDCRKTFVDEHGLSQSAFSRLLSGKRKKHKGFTIVASLHFT